MPVGCFVRMRTVSVPTASIEAIAPVHAEYGAALIRMSRLYFAAVASNGSPLVNFTFGRSFSSSVLSSMFFQLVASPGRITGLSGCKLKRRSDHDHPHVFSAPQWV